MSSDGLLKFTDLLPGLAALLRRLPFIVYNLLVYLKLKPDARLSIGAVFERNAARYGDSAAVLWGDTLITHRQFNREVNRYANCFISHGFKNGDVVAVLVANRPELQTVIGALAKIGAVAALVDPDLPEELLRQRLTVAAAQACIVDKPSLNRFDAIKTELDSIDLTRLFLLIYNDGPRDRRLGDYIDLFSKSRRCSPDNPTTDYSVTLQSPFAYVYTSGTTGMPKASVQIHRRWIGAMYWFGKVLLNLRPGDVHYCPLPFYHTNALIIAWGAAAGCGAAVAMRSKFSVGEFWTDCRKFNATSFIYVGEICRYLLNRPADPNDRSHGIRQIVGNGLRSDIRRQFKKRFGIPRVLEFYGAAEAPLIFTNIFNLDHGVGCCLMAYALVRYDEALCEPVRNRQGRLQKVNRGEAGLLLSEVSRDLIFRGYTSKAQTDQKIVRNGFKQGDMWFNSGDILEDMGYRHADFRERLGDTFRWKGENVSCAEIERVARQCDDIAAAAAYGVHVPETEGRAGMLAIVPKGRIADFDIGRFTIQLQRRLPSYAMPLFLRMTHRIDTTPTHKIVKRKLIDEGYHPGTVADDLYVLLPGRSQFSPLDMNVHAAIHAGRYRF